MSIRRNTARQARAVAVIGAGLLSWHSMATAEDASAAGDFGGVNWSYSGFVRFDSAYKTTDHPNIVNQRDNPFNGKTVHRSSFPLAAGLPVTEDDATRNGVPKNEDWNLMNFRLKFDLTVNLNQNMKIVSTLRGIYDWSPYEAFDPDEVDSVAAGFNYGRGKITTDHPNGKKHKTPNYYEYDSFYHGGSINPLEFAGRKYMLDLPALYLDYQSGPLLVRVGNQQIAWGQALFFRVLDVPNGLDLRRHLFLDYAPEEYADERVPALGIRSTFQLSQDWELDGFVQKFQPSIYPNANTPYNAVASQFSVHESYSKRFDDKFNGGIRARGSFGQWGVQGIAVRRYNPDGVFRWTQSGVVRDIPGLTGSGALMAQTPLEVDSTGVWTGEEWFTYAGDARLDGVGGLNTIIAEFPAAGALGGFAVPDEETANRELDLFFQLAGGYLTGNPGQGGLRGHIVHEYDQETVLGVGGSYVASAEPGSIFDQLIINLETSYTPNKTFTSSTLSRKYEVHDEWVTALVMEKYQRLSQDFPATYFVFQALHKSQSDLFGRYLGCMGGTGASPDGDGENKRCHDVDGGFNAVVFALQQPSPTLNWRVDFATLYDIKGGIFMQPAIRFSPSSTFTAEFYYNYIDGGVRGKANMNIMQTIDYADELGVRLSMQF